MDRLQQLGIEMQALGVRPLFVAVGILGLSSVAEAAEVYAPAPISAETADPSTRTINREWTLTLGAYAMAQPDYPGSDDYEFAARPIISVSRADHLSRWRSFNDNPSIALYDTGFVEAGITGTMNWKRDSSDSPDLRGLKDIDYAYQVGGYAQWYPVDWLRLRADLRYGFGGFEGTVADLAADAIYFTDFWGGMAISAGPRMTLASSGYIDTYYGITPEEAAAAQALGNNLTPYKAGGGIYSVGVGGQILKRFTPNILGSVFVEYKYLMDDAANSPLVEQNGDRNQFQAGVSLSYTFFLGFE